MEFQEYPKAVYKLDDQRIVQDAAAEEQASSDGYGPWVCKTLRESAAAPLPDDDQSTSTKAELMAALDAAGIDYDKRLGAEKLRALLP